MSTPKLTQAIVRAECKALGVSFKSLPETGEFRLRFLGAEYFTDDLADAAMTARTLFKQLPGAR